MSNFDSYDSTKLITEININNFENHINLLFDLEVSHIFSFELSKYILLTFSFFVVIVGKKPNMNEDSPLFS